MVFKKRLVIVMVLSLILINGVLNQYMSEILENVFDQASKELEEENRMLEKENELVNKGNFLRLKRASNDKLQKDPSSLHSSVSKTTLESQKLHESFKIALRASKILQQNNSIGVNHTATLKLKAPPKFCPFAFEPSCDGFAKYRKIDGSCNNPDNSLIGKTSTPYKRLLRTAYEDKLDEPRKTGVDGDPLPNPREIALKVHDPLDSPSRSSNYAVMFGQFMDHDFALSATTGIGSSPVKCMCNSNNPDCVNIPTPDDDMFDDQQCQVLTRSSASFDKFDCSLGAREQLNLLTHWLDLSQIYGNDIDQHNKLRSFIDGKLKTSSINGFSREYLPHARAGICVDETDEELCFESGDIRTSQNLMLVSIHTVWLREHNRIATMLKKLNPTWTDEDLYQEARRIVIAEYQNTIYSEWLPIFIGKSLVKLLGLEMQHKKYFMGYDSSVNPHLASEFTTTAFRFGHTFLRSSLSKSDIDYNQLSNLTLSNIMLRPTEAYRDGGLDSICRGLLVDPGTSFDPHFTEEIQNHLFETGATDVQTRRFSLSSINIMRGRDHGIPPYNEFRKFVGLNVAKSFDDLSGISPETQEKLKQIYKNVDDIDSFTGGTSEIVLSDALLGPTFANIVARQFRDLKLGDQYYFENGHNETTRFTLAQLNQIRKSTMSRILCDNLDINTIQKNAFLPSSSDNPIVNCKNIKKVNLKKWKDEPLPRPKVQDQSSESTSGDFF